MAWSSLPTTPFRILPTWSAGKAHATPFEYRIQSNCPCFLRYFIYGMQDEQNLERVRLSFDKFKIPGDHTTQDYCHDGYLKVSITLETLEKTFSTLTEGVWLFSPLLPRGKKKSTHELKVIIAKHFLRKLFMWLCLMLFLKKCTLMTFKCASQIIEFVVRICIK